MVSHLFPITISSGPSNILLSSTSAQFGTRRTLPLIWGIVAVFALQIALVGVGVGEIIFRFPSLFLVFKIIGALYLFYLAWRFFRTSGMQTHGETKLGFQEGVLVQFFNFKALTVPLILYTQFLNPSTSTRSLYVDPIPSDCFDNCALWIDYWQFARLGCRRKSIATGFSIGFWGQVAGKNLGCSRRKHGADDPRSTKRVGTWEMKKP